MNEQEFIRLLGREEYDNIQRLSKKCVDTIRELTQKIPVGVRIDSVKVGLEGEDFLKNEASVIIRYKLLDE